MSITGDAVRDRKIPFLTFPEPRRRACVRSLSRARESADPGNVELGSLNFAIWWYVTLFVLGGATWYAARSRPQIGFEQVALVFLVGIAAGLTMYLVPSGLASMQAPQDLLLRFFCALAISWLAAIRALPAESGPGGYPSLALAGFAGVNAPLLALVASSFMVCGGGQPTCAL